MHPLLILTYILNLVLLSSVFGFLGVFFGVVGSIATFYLISKDGGDQRKHWGQIGAIAIVHLAGVVAVIFAPWGSPAATATAVIMELFIVAIFSSMGRI